MDSSSEAFQRRLVKLLNVPLEEIHGVFSNPNTSASEAPCWQWTKSTTGQNLMPIFWYQGSLKPVRRVMWEAYTGQTLDAYDRVHQTCATPICVQPAHCHLVQRRKHGLFRNELAELGFMPAEESAEEDTLEDAAHAIYSRDPPWDAQQLATEFNYPLALMVEAIAAIKRGEM